MNDLPLIAAVAHALFAARKAKPSITNVELAKVAVATIEARRIYYRFDDETKALVPFDPKERAA